MMKPIAFVTDEQDSKFKCLEFLVICKVVNSTQENVWCLFLFLLLGMGLEGCEEIFHQDIVWRDKEGNNGKCVC